MTLAVSPLQTAPRPPPPAPAPAYAVDGAVHAAAAEAAAVRRVDDGILATTRIADGGAGGVGIRGGGVDRFWEDTSTCWCDM